jgi:hypothetical protein
MKASDWFGEMQGQQLEDDLRYIVDSLNPRIASLLNKPVLEPTVQWVPIIETHTKRDPATGTVTRHKVRGRAFIKECRVEVVLGPGWHVALIEELAHLYLPDVSHRKVKQTVRNIVKSLKWSGK